LQGEIIFTAMQLNKNIKIFLNYFLGPLLFAWLGFSIYRQILTQAHLETSWLYIRQSFQSVNLFNVLLVVFLMVANWGIEAKKWQLSVASIYHVNFIKAFKAILSGVAFSVTMPNRIGEYFGRMLYMPEGNRLKSISVTLVGSLSQLYVTIISGAVGFIFLKNQLIQHGIINDIVWRFALAGFVFAIIVLTVIYFRIAIIEKLFEKWIKNSSYVYLIESLRTFNVQLLLRVMLLSFLRYLVFLVQYYLMFSLFDIALPFVIVWSVVSVLFLVLAIIPTIALVEVGLRGEISLRLMGMFTTNNLGVSLASVSIWFINLVLPAIVGSILFLGIKVFNRKNERN
jgi:hypothetical protein